MLLFLLVELICFPLCCVLISLWLSVLPILYLQLEEMWGWSRGSHHSQHLTATSTVLVPLYFGGNLWTLFGFIWFLVGQHFHNIQTKGIKCLQLLFKEKKKKKKEAGSTQKHPQGFSQMVADQVNTVQTQDHRCDFIYLAVMLIIHIRTGMHLTSTYWDNRYYHTESIRYLLEV